MNEEHVIADEVLELIQLALLRGENWMAFNNSLYFISKEDIHFFSSKDLAYEFAESNISDVDDFKVMHFRSIDDVLKKIPYGEEMERVINSTQTKSINYSTIQSTTMNDNNFDYLKDNIKYMGFGEKLFGDLEANLKAGKPEFQLDISTEVNKKQFDAKLNFRKSDNSDMYFFNSYEASLKRSNGEEVKQKFYLNNGKGVTAKEAYNLLEGRAVHKELANKENEPYKAWIQLDFDKKDKNNNFEVKQYHENYGYDLKAALSKYGIAELEKGEEKTLLQSLQKGNVQSVSIEKDGATSKMFVEANPQYKTINIYDASFRSLNREQKQGLEKKQDSPKEAIGNGVEKTKEEKQTTSKDKKQKQGRDDLDAPKQNKGRSKSRSAKV